jgi:hypothetical protein
VDFAEREQRAVRAEKLWRARVSCVGLMCITALFAGRAEARTHAAEQMSIQVNNDRLTVSVAKAPQIYLYGVIDADAPQRFEALVRSGKVPPGSDIYLNSSSGDVHAGMALGRLFRAGSMATHLGTPRRPRNSGYIKTAICSGACAYAYFGGFYRWAPTGSDRLALPAPTAAVAAAHGVDETATYLKDMGIDVSRIASGTSTTQGGLIWLNADQMTAAGLANNGRQSLLTTSRLLPPAPFLQLRQVDHHGEHRITLECHPGVITITAYDQVGTTRAREIASRGTSSYLQLDAAQAMVEAHGGATVADGAVVIQRTYPSSDLVKFLSARTVGAWVSGRSSAFRDGFSFNLYPVRKALEDYYYACWHAAPWPARK